MSEPFYLCKTCKEYIQGKKMFKEHKATCVFGSSATKRRKLSANLPSESRVGPSQSNRNPPSGHPVMVEKHNKNIPKSPFVDNDDQDTDECSPAGIEAFKRSRAENEDDNETPFRITSVVGHYRKSPVVVNREDIWKRERETIPVLLEKIKVEPNSPTRPQRNEGMPKEVDLSRRLQIKLEPITDAIRKYVFKTSRKADNEPVTFPPSNRKDIDFDVEKIPQKVPTISSTPILPKVGTYESESDKSVEDCPKAGPPAPKKLPEHINISSQEKIHIPDSVKQIDVSSHPERLPAQLQDKNGKHIGIIVGAWKIMNYEKRPDTEDDEEELSPACSYVKALNESVGNVRCKRKRKAKSLDFPAEKCKDNLDLELPKHITLLKGSESAKPEYKCNNCEKTLYNPSQFFPHEQCVKKKSKQKPEADEPEGKVYCICRQPYRGIWHIRMIQCTECIEWYHGKCMGLSDEFLDSITANKVWLCFKCRAKKLEKDLKEKKRGRRSTMVSMVGCSDSRPALVLRLLEDMRETDLPLQSVQ